MVRLSDRVVDKRGLIVVSDGTRMRLAPREVDVLRFLWARLGDVVSRDEILKAVFDIDDPTSRAVDGVVRRLRSKLETDPEHPVHLISEYGVGYRLTAGPPPVAEPCARERQLLPLSNGSVDLDAGLVHRDGGAVQLVGNELLLLRVLARSAGQVLEAQAIERQVWGSVLRDTHRLRSLVGHLRAKVEANPSSPVHILSVRGHGYRFVKELQAPAGPEVTVLAAGVAETQTERLWQAALAAADLSGGYTSTLVSGLAVLVFHTPAAARRAAEVLIHRVRGVRLGLATGPAQSLTNPLSQRVELVGSAVRDACRLAAPRRTSQAVLPHQPSERVPAA